MIKFLIPLVTGLVIAIPGQTETLTLRPLPKGASASFLTPSGYLAGVKADNEPPFLFGVRGDYHRLGSFAYTPSAANSLNDVVGVRSISGTTYSSDYTHYVFYTPSEKESVLLTSLASEGSWRPSVSINDSGSIVVLLADKVLFFDREMKIAEYIPQSGVVLNTDAGITALPNGDALFQISQIGTFRWARVTSSGQVTLIPETALPLSVSSIRGRPDGRVTAYFSGALYEFDLQASPTQVKLPKLKGTRDLFAYARNGKNEYVATLKSDKSQRYDFPSYVYSFDHFVAGNFVSGPIQCAQPNLKRLKVEQVNDIAETGVMWVGLGDKEIGRRDGLMSFNEKRALSNYCPQLTTTIVGKCSKYFDGLTQVKAVKNTVCTAQVTLKDYKGHAIQGAQVVTQLDGREKVSQGTTNKKGKVTFDFKIDSDSSSYALIVLAPYGDKKWLGASERILFAD